MQTQQINLLKNIKFFFNKFDNLNFLPYRNSVFYLATYSNFIGSYILSSLSGRKNWGFLKNSFIIMRDIIYSLNYINVKVLTPPKNLIMIKLL